jgi:hypothetical protein
MTEGYISRVLRCLIALTMFALAERLWNRGLEMVTAASPREVP